MRKVHISNAVRLKIVDLRTFLVVEYNLSEYAAYKRIERIRVFLDSLSIPADYALCRFKKWQELGYRCAVFEKSWVFAYEVFDDGVIVRDMSHAAMLLE
ncbi:MAG: hypothetical protein FWH36_01445 [Lentimicrobiaceae bacterium]|nr:hypothetical protein [Lentimicrobiaceae bacterium]